MTNRKSLFVRVAAVAAIILFGIAASPSYAQDQMKPVADQLAAAFDYYTQADFEKGIDLSNKLLKRPDLQAKDSAAIYSILSMCNYALGQDYVNKSVGYLEDIVKIDPCIIQLPNDFWPQELRDRWYKILEAKSMLTCPEGEKVKTIAIMQFDNYSVGDYQEQLGYISKGLADMFASDFSKFSSIKVIERDKINSILSELELQKSGKVDQATAVKAGKLLGANIMVFGSITQLDPRNMRMVVRAVNVETSEIITSVDKEGKPDYFKVEKELVEELANKLDVKFDEKTKDLLKAGGTDSEDATTLYSRGLDYADKYDYKNAYDSFKKAYDLDTTFAEAKHKMEIYKPLAG